MEDTLSKSKRLAKNTFLLYLRMFVVMIVALFTSRVTLNTLGVEDYGIFNVIAGVIVFFTFLNATLSNSGQRFLSVAIAKDDKTDIQKTFTSLLLTHLLLAIVLILLLETIGLWFVKTKLDIPLERQSAAMIVYHTSVLGVIFGVMKIPFNSVIIATERMSFYAYTSIAEVLLKLLVVYLLVLFDIDKLVLYSWLQVGVGAFMFLWYSVYVRTRFDDYHISIHYHKDYFRKVIAFSGWNALESGANLGYQQGNNFILNHFYGVVLNAAMGVYMSVRSVLFSFVTNFQVSANPQIIKAYSVNETDYFYGLIYRVSKYGFYLMFFIGLPLILNIDYILRLWLINPPDYTAGFIVYGVCFSMIETLHGPLWTSMQAMGKIKVYEIVTSLMLLLNLPLTFLFLKWGHDPYSIIKIQIFVSLLIIIVRLLFSKYNVGLSIRRYFLKVCVPIILVLIVSVPVPLFLSMSITSDLMRLLVTGVVSIIIVALSVLYIGSTAGERDALLGYVKKFLPVKRKKS